MSTYIVDTHALVWYFDEDKRLSKRAERILDETEVTLIIPTVVLAEVKYLFKKKRISISFDQVVEEVEEDTRCIVYPFDFACVEALDDRLNLHDGVIVATGVVYRDLVDSSTKIITRDKAIKESDIIETIW
ncbi:MAG: PIN domain-containing protein [bacterium]|nr:PIN domain-containing protein [bacterium]